MSHSDETFRKASALRDQVLKTWDPPLITGSESPAVIAQSSVMISLAFLYGRDFFPPLTVNQQAAIDGGLSLFERVIK